MTHNPDFTAAQKRELRKMGVRPEQIEELRDAAAWAVKRILRPRAARNDLLALLERVSKASADLTRVLITMAVPIDAAHSEASNLIERAYWTGDRLHDDGPNVAVHLLPRLEALSSAAKSGIAALPKSPTRHRVGDWKPIKEIHEALWRGWVRAYDPNCSAGSWEDVLEGRSEYHPYPDDLCPSASPTSSFRRIVGLCYTLAGAGNSDPERALKGYMAVVTKEEKKLLAGLEEVLVRAQRSHIRDFEEKRAKKKRVKKSPTAITSKASEEPVAGDRSRTARRRAKSVAARPKSKA